MTAKFKNSIIYLIGFAGVGKRTIAAEICKQAGFRLIDNHTINNVVFPFVRVDSDTKMPQEIWQSTREIRKIALKTMVDIGNRDFSYVFTNLLLENDEGDLEIFNQIEDAARKIDAQFMPVRILCDPEENRRRIANPERNKNFKISNAEHIDKVKHETVLHPSNPHTFTIDVTKLTAEDAATEILRAFQNKFYGD